jgi:hypothetical protein
MIFKGSILHSRFAIRILVPRSSDAGVEQEAKATARLEYVQQYRCAVGGEGVVGSRSEQWAAGSLSFHGIDSC